MRIRLGLRSHGANASHLLRIKLRRKFQIRSKIICASNSPCERSSNLIRIRLRLMRIKSSVWTRHYIVISELWKILKMKVSDWSFTVLCPALMRMCHSKRRQHLSLKACNILACARRSTYGLWAGWDLYRVTPNAIWERIFFAASFEEPFHLVVSKEKQGTLGSYSNPDPHELEFIWHVIEQRHNYCIWIIKVTFGKSKLGSAGRTPISSQHFATVL
jgi:hypothetical protein